MEANPLVAIGGELGDVGPHVFEKDLAKIHLHHIKVVAGNEAKAGGEQVVVRLPC